MEISISEALNRGIDAESAGNVIEAAHYCSAILTVDDKHPEANHRLGIIEMRTGKVEAAVQYFKVALNAKSDVAQYWVSFIEALIELNQFDEANLKLIEAEKLVSDKENFNLLKVKISTELKNYFNKSETELIDEATKLRETGKFTKATALLEKSILRFPQNSHIIVLLAQIYLLTNKIENAAKLIEDAKQLDPRNPKVSINEARLYIARKQVDKALVLAKETNKLFPNDIEGMALLGVCYRLTGNRAASFDNINKVIEKNDSYAEAYVNRGLLYLTQNEKEKALKDFDTAYELKPFIQAVQNFIVDLRIELSDYSGAIETLSKILSSNPGKEELFLKLGLCHQHMRNYESAINAYNRALAIQPNYPEALNDLGVALREIGQLNASVNALDKAVALKPDVAAFQNNLGISMNSIGRADSALNAYNQAIELNPNYAEAYNNLGKLLKEMGDLDGAIKAYETAILKKPNYAEAYNNMSFCKLQTDDWQIGLDLRSFRWQTPRFKTQLRIFSAPTWDGVSPTEDKTLLIWGEQGPGDMVIWSSCFEYYINKFKKVIIECPKKLVGIFKLNFPGAIVREEQRQIAVEDFDHHIPMETLFGYACKSGVCNEKQAKYIMPDQSKVHYFRERLNEITDLPCVGISWKSPVMNVHRSKNYADVCDWEVIFKNSNVKFVNLQSANFEDDILYFSEKFNLDIISFHDLNQYDDLLGTAALLRALDLVVSVGTTTAMISSAVGTRTFIPTWRQSAWNNIVFNSRGPEVEIYLKDTWEDWSKVLGQISNEIAKL